MRVFGAQFTLVWRYGAGALTPNMPSSSPMATMASAKTVGLSADAASLSLKLCNSIPCIEFGPEEVAKNIMLYYKYERIMRNALLGSFQGCTDPLRSQHLLCSKLPLVPVSYWGIYSLKYMYYPLHMLVPCVHMFVLGVSSFSLCADPSERLMGRKHVIPQFQAEKSLSCLRHFIRSTEWKQGITSGGSARR